MFGYNHKSCNRYKYMSKYKLMRQAKATSKKTFVFCQFSLLFFECVCVHACMSVNCWKSKISYSAALHNLIQVGTLFQLPLPCLFSKIRKTSINHFKTFILTLFYWPAKQGRVLGNVFRQRSQTSQNHKIQYSDIHNN